MIIILSPAKTQSFEDDTFPGVEAEQSRLGVPGTDPVFLERSADLVRLLRSLDEVQIKALFRVSDEIAAETLRRIHVWRGALGGSGALPAIQVLRGEAFRAFDARTLSVADLRWAGNRLRIFSGLYGLLRPMDLIEPYRLDAQTRLENPYGPTVFHAWRDAVGSRIAAELGGSLPDRGGVVLNLASGEYARLLTHPGLKGRVVTATFKEQNGDARKIVGVYAKRARGLMARWIVRSRIVSPGQIDGFHEEGYALAPDLSCETERVFVRERA